nr:ABC transporter permease [Phytohabitans houttuyneae]
MTVAAPGRTTPMAGPVRLAANVATIAGRNLRRLTRVPTLIAFATAQPVLFVLLFTYAWGGAVHPPGVERYIDYLLPGVWVLAIAFGASQTAVAVADDLATGMIDRFRALPVARSAVLAGRVAADTVRNLFVLALMTGVGYAIGFRFHAGPAAAAAAIGLALCVGIAFSWVFALLGLLVRDPEAAGTGGLLAVIPLIFTSSTFVPVATFPAGCKPSPTSTRSPPPSTPSARCAWAAPPPPTCGTPPPGSWACSPSPCPRPRSGTDEPPPGEADVRRRRVTVVGAGHPPIERLLPRPGALCACRATPPAASCNAASNAFCRPSRMAHRSFLTEANRRSTGCSGQAPTQLRNAQKEARSRTPAHIGAGGRSTVTCRPPPGRGWAASGARCAWAMAATIARPRPCPLVWSVRSVPRR